MAEELFPYESFRPGQREVLKKIREEMGSSRLLVLRAPTGFGKTAIAIATGMMRSPAIHSVRTRNEITPVLRDLKRLSKRVRGVRYSFIHSAHAMCPLLSSERIDPEDFWLNCQILRESGRCSYYKKSLLISEEDVEEILNASENHVDAVKRISRDLGSCPFFSLAKLARGSQYVVATYPYVFSGDLFSTIYPEEDPGEFFAVIDEAHMLTDPSAIFSSEISTSKIEASINEIREYLGGDPFSEALLNRLIRLAEERAVDDRLRKIDRSLLSIDTDAIEHLINIALEVKRRALDRILSRGSVGEAASKRVSLVKVSLTIALLEDPRFEVFAYRNGMSIWIKVTAIDHSVVSEALSMYRASLLMSGTPPTIEYIGRILGIQSASYIDALELGSWSPYNNIATVLTSGLSSRYSERSPNMYDLYSKYIEVIDKLIDGVKLVIHPSYEFMRNVVDRLQNQGFVENRGTTIEDLVRSIGKEGSLVHAVAGGKLSEGIELVMNNRSLIKCVFVAGVPYPQKDEYVDELFKNMRKKVSEDEAWDYIYNMAASMKVLQAIGRAVRGEDDRALVVLGDRRFMSRDIRKYMGLRIGRIARNLKEFETLVKLVASDFL
ncbi:MAG TPA: ATP-dependent DNA helicase [Sulfolobales archaeon]|nr:ATP-dependent DNA helicase [Sulfolobales archaeon]